jgi:mannose-6-phosphate isomerase-like protein (cupin superfamily)
MSRIRFWLGGVSIIIVASCTTPTLPPAGLAAPSTGRALVLQAGEGTPLVFCDTPELRATILVDSTTAGTATLAAGTAELDTSNFGTHAGEDEIVFFLSGSGLVVIAQDTFPARPGTTMYIPRGTRHGFINTDVEPLKFFWVISPAGLAARFRSAAKRPDEACT